MSELEEDLAVTHAEMRRHAAELLRQIQAGEIRDPSMREPLRRLAESTLSALDEYEKSAPEESRRGK
jgi:hypothetical protein